MNWPLTLLLVLLGAWATWRLCRTNHALDDIFAEMDRREKFKRAMDRKEDR